MSKEKINMTIGRFQPFTIGHLNMINEGNAKCVVYQIKSKEMPDNLASLKIGGRKVRKENIQAVIDFMNAGATGELDKIEDELIKRPFTNELILKELDIVKQNNQNIIDVVLVTNAFEAFARFNKFILDNRDTYEAQYWMCGDDRADNYKDIIEKSKDALAIERNGEEFENVIKNTIEVNTGHGRTKGVSGTAVRAAIINNDKQAFTKIMPPGVDAMFDEFVAAYDDFRTRLEQITESYNVTDNYLADMYKIFEQYDGDDIEEQFLKMMSDSNNFNTLMYAAVNIDEALFEQHIEAQDERILKNIRIFGNTYRKVYESYCRCFK